MIGWEWCVTFMSFMGMGMWDWKSTDMTLEGDR